MEIWNTVFDYFKLGLLCMLLCLPVITAGASMTAAFFVAMKMIRGEAPAIWKPYWSSFKQNFKQATALWLMILAVFALLGMDWYLVMQMESTVVNRIVRAGTFIAVLIIAMIFIYLFPLLARYQLTNREIMKNAVIFAILNFPKNLINCIDDFIFSVIMCMRGYLGRSSSLCNRFTSFIAKYDYNACTGTACTSKLFWEDCGCAGCRRKWKYV